MRFFDHRREWSRTDFEAGGTPRPEWEALLAEMRRRADAAGWLRLALPREYGGRDAGNLEMAIIREHLATKGLGLFNDRYGVDEIAEQDAGTVIVVTSRRPARSAGGGARLRRRCSRTSRGRLHRAGWPPNI